MGKTEQAGQKSKVSGGLRPFLPPTVLYAYRTLYYVYSQVFSEGGTDVDIVELLTCGVLALTAYFVIMTIITIAKTRKWSETVDREQLVNFILSNVMSPDDVREECNISRQRLNDLNKAGRISPIKNIGKAGLYLRQDVERLRKELKENAKYKSNVYK